LLSALSGEVMKAALFRGQGAIEICEVPRPEPNPGELLIRVAANGICGSDRKALDAGYPHVTGHEVVGTVVEAAEGCQTPVGARIAVYIPRYCGKCVICRTGRENLCPHKAGLLGWATDGGYAEYMVVPDRNALRLDDRIPFDQGVVLLDTVGTSSHGLRLASAETAESVLVIGAGPIGMGAVAYLSAMGVSSVYVSEMSPYRRRMAEAYGAIAIDPKSEDVSERIHSGHPYGVDVVFEGVGSLSTIWQSFDLVHPGGTINLVGEYWGRVELDRPKSAWMINDIHVIRSFYFTISEFYENQRLILNGTLKVDSLASHRFALEELRAAYDLFLAGEGIKVLVTP